MVVLHQTEFAILIFNKEDWSSHQGLGGLNLYRFKVLFQKDIQFLLFRGREQIDLAAFWRGIGGKLDSVIPWLGSGQFTERVLRKHRVEVTKMWWNVLSMICRLRVLLESPLQAIGKL